MCFNWLIERESERCRENKEAVTFLDTSGIPRTKLSGFPEVNKYNEFANAGLPVEDL